VLALPTGTHESIARSLNGCAIAAAYLAVHGWREILGRGVLRFGRLLGFITWALAPSAMMAFNSLRVQPGGTGNDFPFFWVFLFLLVSYLSRSNMTIVDLAAFSAKKNPLVSV
jgi:hypothetical protein